MRLAFVYLLLLTVGCRKDQLPAPSAEQSAQLNDADAMLNDVTNEDAANSSR